MIPRGPDAFTRLPAAQGALWLREGFLMLREHPVRWLALLVIFYLIVGALDYLPWIGPFAHLMLKPVFTVGFLAAAWSQERGGRPEIPQLFRGFAANLRALLGVGLVLVAGVAAAAIATALFAGGDLAALVSGPAPIDRNSLDAPEVQAGLLAMALTLVPVMLATWFAPALVVFQDCGTRRAVATSFRAAIANWRAIAVYCALVFFYGVIAPTFVLGIVATIVPESAQGGVVIAIMLPWFAVLLSILQIADYVSYRDVFHADESVVADTTTSGPHE